MPYKRAYALSPYALPYAALSTRHTALVVEAVDERQQQLVRLRVLRPSRQGPRRVEAVRPQPGPLTAELGREMLREGLGQRGKERGVLLPEVLEVALPLLGHERRDLGPGLNHGLHAARLASPDERRRRVAASELGEQRAEGRRLVGGRRGQGRVERAAARGQRPPQPVFLKDLCVHYVIS